jgi:catalase
MNVLKNQEKSCTYYFNSLNIGPKADAAFTPSPLRLDSNSPLAGRFDFRHPATEYEQVRILYRLILSESDRTNLIKNIVASLGNCRHDIQRNMIRLFSLVDEDYGTRIQ